MPANQFQRGESFPIQFAWRLPDDGKLFAIFRAAVVELIPAADKYIVRLGELLAGRETNAAGESLPASATSRDYWALVGGLQGKLITVAYEADDGRALPMRLETLTGEHNFFTRFATPAAAAAHASSAEVAASATQLDGEDPTP